MHTVDDEVVDIARAYLRGGRAARGSDHLVTGHAAAQRLAAVIVDWLDATM